MSRFKGPNKDLGRVLRGQPEALQPEKRLTKTHGAEARRLARDWIGTKFNALPAEEIEVLLAEDE